MTPLVLHDAHSGATARILPDLGFNCYSFQAPVAGRTIDVLDAEPDFESGKLRPTKSGIPLLFPFPNRIRGGRYCWKGRDFQFPVDVRGDTVQRNAIHGLVLDRPWRVVSTGPSFACGEFQLGVDARDRLHLWPADFKISVRYELQVSALHCTIRILNPGPEPLPWGFGTHPYFRLPLSAGSASGDCLIQAQATHYWELEENLPTGNILPVAPTFDLSEGQPFSSLQLDHVLTRLDHKRGAVSALIMDPTAGLQVTQTAAPLFRELTVFTPPHRRSICLEPYTCVTDAINLQALGIDAGWQVLPAGEEVETWIRIEAGLVVA